MTIIQCNWCMAHYNEDSDNQITTCKKCNTDKYLMETNCNPDNLVWKPCECCNNEGCQMQECEDCNDILAFECDCEF